jgi:amino acid permease
VRNDRLLAAAAVVIGIALIVVGVIYLVQNEHAIPSFFPGHSSQPSSHHHAKHGIAAILLGLACLAFAWFRTGPRDRANPPAA